MTQSRDMYLVTWKRPDGKMKSKILRTAPSARRQYEKVLAGYKVTPRARKEYPWLEEGWVPGAEWARIEVTSTNWVELGSVEAEAAALKHKAEKKLAATATHKAKPGGEGDAEIEERRSGFEEQMKEDAEVERSTADALKAEAWKVRCQLVGCDPETSVPRTVILFEREHGLTHYRSDPQAAIDYGTELRA